MPYKLAVTDAGKTREYEKYYDYQDNRTGGGHRLPRKQISPEAKRKLNDRQAIKKLRRLMNANFDNRSWYLTMDCIREQGEEYATPEEMKMMLSHFQRKCRTFWKKHSSELRYVSVMAVGLRSARHFHIVLSACKGIEYTAMRESLQSIWDSVYMKPGKRRSYIHLENLYGDNYGDLAAYFVKQSNMTLEVLGRKIGKRWNSSRNLIKPVTKIKRITNREAFRLKVTAPAGWYIDSKYTEIGEGSEEYGGYGYMRYILIRSENIRS